MRIQALFGGAPPIALALENLAKAIEAAAQSPQALNCGADQSAE